MRERTRPITAAKTDLGYALQCSDLRLPPRWCCGWPSISQANMNATTIPTLQAAAVNCVYKQHMLLLSLLFSCGPSPPAAALLVGLAPTRFRQSRELLQLACALSWRVVSVTLEGQALSTSLPCTASVAVAAASAAPCDAACENHLQQGKQLHIALHRSDQFAAQRVFINTGTAGQVESLTKPAHALSRSCRASGNRQLPARTGVACSRAAGASFTSPTRSATLMMRYADPPDLRGVLKDQSACSSIRGFVERCAASIRSR